MTFNRYETLIKHYTNQILQWDWDLIKKSALENCRVNDDQDTVYGQTFLGTPIALYPSGKIYAFWTSNQTRSDVTKDECFIEALEAIAESKDMYIDYDEDIFACMIVEDKTQVISYVTDTDQEMANEIFGV